MKEKIRVLVVDDSIFFRTFMADALCADSLIEVVGLASDAFEAKEKIEALKPHVITLDVEMPKMRGTDFLRQIRPKYPNIQVVVISSLSNNVFEALRAGAVDFVSKPNKQLNMDNDAFIREILQKIKVAASLAHTKAPAAAPVPVPPHGAAPAQATVTAATAAAAKAASKVFRPAGPVLFKNSRAVIAIGASTGGTEAILEVLKDLPANTPGIVIVQHMPPIFTAMYAERLNKICKINVREAADGDRVEAGLALIAPGGERQMRVQKDTRGFYVRITPGEKVSGHCPSVDVLFESVAQNVGRDAIGVILTGMGADGAKNLLAMKKAGAYTIGQDQASCVVYGMPMAAYNIGGVADQMSLSAIPDAILNKLT